MFPQQVQTGYCHSFQVKWFPDYKGGFTGATDLDNDSNGSPFNSASGENPDVNEKQQRRRRTRWIIFLVLVSCFIVSSAIAATVVLTDMPGKKRKEELGLVTGF